MAKSTDLYFSIVIPLYNKEPHIAETLQSVLAQTYQHFEVIVVNDASTDKSREIVTEFSDPRIRIVDRDTPGAGGAAARNRGIKEAKYDYIAFLDADDFWKSDHLKWIKSLIEQFPEAGFYTGGWIQEWDAIGKKQDVYSNNFGPQENHQINLVDFLKFGVQEACPVCTIVAIVKKDLIQKVGGFPVDKCPYGVDIDTWLRIMIESDCIAVSPQIHAIYNRNAINMVSKANNLEVIKSCIRITTDSHLPDLEEPVQKLMKRFVNFYQLLVLKRRAAAGLLQKEDFRYVYPDVDQKKVRLLRFYSYLPGIIQKLYFSIKLRF